MIYLYIFEDGAIRQSSEHPTAEDLECVDCGILTVVFKDSDDFYEILAAGKIKKVDDCAISDTGNFRSENSKDH